MKLRTILAGSAVAALALAADLGTSNTIFAVPQAEAATTVSISLFYNELASHGDWVRYNDAYVFIPANVRAGWRPYTEGRWVYADNVGWTWASDEAFGWATYHYGRWGYADDIGWYWVPGTRWAPAWVSWRRSNDHVVWAPLPPARGGRGDADVDVAVVVEDIPAFFWVAVPTRRFLEPNIRTVVIRDDRELRRVVQRTDFVGTVRVRSNVVVNTVIDIRIIERETRQRVRRVEARRTDNPREARATGDQIVIFEGQVRREREARPPRVREASEVRKVTRDRAAGEDAAPEDATGTTNAAEDAPDASPAPRPRRNQATGTENGNEAENGNARSTAEERQDEQAPAANNRRQRNNANAEEQRDNDAPAANPRRQRNNNTAEGAEQGEEGEATPRQQRRRQRAQEASPDQPAASGNAAEQRQEPARKRRAEQRRERQNADDAGDATGSTRAAPEAGNENAKPRRRAQERRQQACDPAEPGCERN